nr:hypothetical protein [Algoriphagus marinus]
MMRSGFQDSQKHIFKHPFLELLYGRQFGFGGQTDYVSLIYNGQIGITGGSVVNRDGILIFTMLADGISGVLIPQHFSHIFGDKPFFAVF